MISKPEEYRWSSYPDYIGERKAPDWLTTKLLQEYFGKGENARKNYRKFVEELIGQEYESPLNGVLAATILGSDEFVKQISSRHIERKQNDRDVPAVKKLKNRPSIEAIIQTVQGVIHEEKNAIKASIYLCHKFSDATLKKIGQQFGVGESAVSQTRRRFALQIKEDEELSKVIDRMKEMLHLSRV
jgi:DNA-directed RNA polymerase specialized sigma subunit